MRLQYEKRCWFLARKVCPSVFSVASINESRTISKYVAQIPGRIVSVRKKKWKMLATQPPSVPHFVEYQYKKLKAVWLGLFSLCHPRDQNSSLWVARPSNKSRLKI